VLTNLAVNAGHAMNGRGTVAIAVRAERPNPATAQTLGIDTGRLYFTVIVADDGCGMDAGDPGLHLRALFSRQSDPARAPASACPWRTESAELEGAIAVTSESAVHHVHALHSGGD